MARCERYTGGEERKVFIENSRERRCSVTKDETCNNRGICSFYSSLVLSPNGFQTVGLQVRVPSENLLLSPRTSLSRVSSDLSVSASSASPPAVIFFLPPPPRRRRRRRRRWCRCRLFLNFAVAAAGFLLGREPEQTPACCAAASNYMVIQIIGDDYRLSAEPVCYVSRQLEIPFRDFTENVGPSLTPPRSQISQNASRSEMDEMQRANAF